MRCRTMALRDRDAQAFAERVCLGEIAGAHGVKGVVRVWSFTSEPAAIAAYGTLTDAGGERKFELKMIGMSRSHVLAEIAGVTDRSAAVALKGTRLYVARTRLPAAEADEYYHGELIGLIAEFAHGARLGPVIAVEDFGAGTVLEIAREDGAGPVLVPFTRAVVPEVDVARGRLVIDPPPGLLEPVEAGEAAGEAKEKVE